MKIGILGTGGIAHTVANTLKKMNNIECFSVASRTPEKAERFRRENGFERAYGNYEELVKDPEVELIYIATPHSTHKEYMRLCMKYGKPFICEKPFTVNAEQAREIRDYAKAHGIFAAEAMWTRFMPSRKVIRELIDNGVIGTPYYITSNLSYKMDEVPRIIKPVLAGGALLDIGVYGINFALMNFGSDIEKIETSAEMTDTGVDAIDKIKLIYRDGRFAELTHSIYEHSDGSGIIQGSMGRIYVDNIIKPSKISVYDSSGNLTKEIDVRCEISGYEYEFYACADAIQSGELQTPQMPLDESIRVLEIMDKIRSKWNLTFPCE